MTTLWILKDHQRDKLIGIYSTKRKLKRAAKEFIKLLATDPTKVTSEEAEGELLWWDTDGFDIAGERWQVDKALINGEWKII